MLKTVAIPLFSQKKEFPGPGIPFRSYGLADLSSTVDLYSLEYIICGSFAAHLFDVLRHLTATDISGSEAVQNVVRAGIHIFGDEIL